jgi:hypothetical protein
MTTRCTSYLRKLAALLTIIALTTLAQIALAQSPAPSSPGTLSLPRPDFHFKGEVGRTYQDSDPATFPQIVPAEGRAQYCSHVA